MFNNLIQKFGAFLVSILMATGIYAPSPLPQNQNIQPNETEQIQFSGYNTSGGGTYRLKSSAGISDTTINLSSFKEPVSNLAYTMSYFNSSIEYGTIEPQISGKSEFVSFTGITQNSDGSAQLTGVTRGLTRTPAGAGCTASTTLAVRHAAQSTFILSDSPCLFAEYAVKQNDETITGSWTVPTPTAAGNPTPKSYVDALVNGGTVSTDRITVAGTAGDTYATGTIVYYNTDASQWLKADADFASSTDGIILGIAQGAGTDGVAINGGVVVSGIDSNQGTSLTPGQILYLSNTAGATSTSAGTFSKALGLVKDSDEFYFDPRVSNIWSATSTFQGNVVSTAFGGTGRDGALSISSGTTTLDVASSTLFVKNYTSISITGTGALEFSGQQASGTVIVLKSQGDCTLTSSKIAIYNRNFGGKGGIGVQNATGTIGAIGLELPTGKGPGGGTPGSRNGLSGSSGFVNFGLGGDIASTTQITATTSILATKSLPLILGGGGGGGGGGASTAVGGLGGRGAGAIVIQCGGSLNFTSQIMFRGQDGSNGTGNGSGTAAGGGGGGGGGTVWVIANYITANTGTVNVGGGVGGGSSAGSGSGDGGSGGGGGSSNSKGNNGENTVGTGTGVGGVGGTGGTGVYGIYQNTDF